MTKASYKTLSRDNELALIRRYQAGRKDGATAAEKRSGADAGAVLLEAHAAFIYKWSTGYKFTRGQDSADTIEALDRRAKREKIPRSALHDWILREALGLILIPDPLLPDLAHYPS